MNYVFNGGTSIEIPDGSSWIGPDGTQYPQNFPKSEIPGMAAVAERVRPIDTDIVVTGSEVQIINGQPTRVWLSRPKTPDELAYDHTSSVKRQIAELEARQTQRRLREATLGVDNGWLANLNSQISALRSSLASPLKTDSSFNPEVLPPE